jgi:prepilin-type N-terminal cleavage/methylation domain-containing protein
MNRAKNIISKRNGFTLVELLIVIIILSILASISVPIYFRIQNRAKESATKAEMSSIAIALELYGSDNLTYPAVSDIENLADELDGYIYGMKTYDAWGVNYRYSFSDGRYNLVSGRIDKTYDTADDIIFSNGMMIAEGTYHEPGHNNQGNTTTTSTMETTTTTENTSTTTAETTTTTTADETTTTLPDYPLWDASTSYTQGTYVIYDGKVYVARHWTLNAEPGLITSPWQEITDEWRSFNVYNAGDEVIFGESTFIARSWTWNAEPGLTTSPWQEQTDEWRSFNVYNAGDEVIFGESTFIARSWTSNAEPGLITSPWQEQTDEWRSFNVYNKNDIVIYEGREYVAKYYNQNSQPGISSAWRLVD